jgi:solute carrier family 35 protein E3
MSFMIVDEFMFCQVLGHTKTVLVLLMGWLFMNDIITYKKLIGMTLAVTGMVSYGYLNSLSSAKD